MPVDGSGTALLTVRLRDRDRMPVARAPMSGGHPQRPGRPDRDRHASPRPPRAVLATLDAERRGGIWELRFTVARGADHFTRTRPPRYRQGCRTPDDRAGRERCSSPRLLGSPHCAAMCGPFVCLYAGQTETAAPARPPRLQPRPARLLPAARRASRARWRPDMNQLGAFAGVPRAAAIVAGTLMVLWGGLPSRRAPASGCPAPRPHPASADCSARVVSRFQDKPPTMRAADPRPADHHPPVRVAVCLRGHRRRHRLRAGGAAGHGGVLGRHRSDDGGGRARRAARPRPAAPSAAGRHRHRPGRPRTAHDRRPDHTSRLPPRPGRALMPPTELLAPVGGSCAHCGLPVPAGHGRTRPRRSSSAAAAAHWCGAFCTTPDWRGTTGLPERRAIPVQSSGRSFEEFDHPAFHALYVRPPTRRAARDRAVPRGRALRRVRVAGGARPARPLPGWPAPNSRSGARWRTWRGIRQHEPGGDRALPRPAGLPAPSVPRRPGRRAAARRGPHDAPAHRGRRCAGRQRDAARAGALQRAVRRHGGGVRAATSAGSAWCW